MKIKDKWKSLKPDVKVGLVTTSIYFATTFGLPAYAIASSEEQPAKVLEPTNLEQITTFEQANTVYDEKLKEYTLDKELDYHECKDLLAISSKAKYLLDEKKPENIEKYFEVKDKVDNLSKQRVNLEQSLDKIKEPDNFFLDYLVEKRAEIKEKTAEQYPGILDKEGSELNITYPADIDLNDDSLKTLIKTIAKDVRTKLVVRYNDDILKGVANTNRDGLELKHIAKLLKVMETYEVKLKEAKKVGGTDVTLKSDIKKLKSEEDTIWKANLSEEDKQLFEWYLENNSDVLSKSRILLEYITYKHNADEYLEKFEDKNVYWSDSILAEVLRGRKEGYNDLEAALENDNRDMVQDSLNNYLKAEGLEAKVADLKNPSNLKFPFAWCIAFNGLILPIIRNIMVRKYVDRDADSEEYFGSVCAAGISWLVGGAITDGLHPLAYWARMASPLVIQPAFKIFGGKKDD